MAKNSFFLQSEEGLSLEGMRWRPDDKEVKAVLLIIHGLGEHIRRYKEFALALNAKGIVVLGIDLRGHGRSDGKRGHIPSLGHVLRDLHLLHQHAFNLYSDLPIFLYGHSLGGNFSLRYLYQSSLPLKGAIVSSPLLGLAFTPPAWKVTLAKVVANIWPKLSQANELNPAYLSHNPEVVQGYINDPLVHNKISTGLFKEMTASMDWLEQQRNPPSIPIILYHGTDDKITDPKRSQAFAEKFPEHIVFHALEGYYHEPHHEEKGKRALKLSLQFIKDEIKKSAEVSSSD